MFYSLGEQKFSRRIWNYCNNDFNKGLVSEEYPFKLRLLRQYAELISIFFF